MNIDINEIFAEVGKLHLQIAQQQKRIAELEVLIPSEPAKDKIKEE